ncbi:MAG: GNAT family N-acetyltransferase [Cyanobacteria bacterium P01_F01_bin.53]
MSYCIRPAVQADVPQLLNLIHLKSEFDGCPEAVKATAEKLSHTLFGPQPMAYVLLAEKQASSQASAQASARGKNSPATSPPIGFASYHFTYSTFLAQPSLWLDDLFIMQEHRNQAVGTRLIQQLCTVANQHNCGRIDWTVDVQNAAGIRFYQRIGGRLQTQVHLCRLNQAAILQHAS